MKDKVSVTLDIDPQAWMETYDVEDLAFETVFGVWSDDPENARCIVCRDPLDLGELPDPNSLLCPTAGAGPTTTTRRTEMPEGTTAPDIWDPSTEVLITKVTDDVLTATLNAATAELNRLQDDETDMLRHHEQEQEEMEEGGYDPGVLRDQAREHAALREALDATNCWPRAVQDEIARRAKEKRADAEDPRAFEAAWEAMPPDPEPTPHDRQFPRWTDGYESEEN